MGTTSYYRISLDHPIAIEHTKYMDARKHAILNAKAYLKSELNPDQHGNIQCQKKNN